MGRPKSHPEWVRGLKLEIISSYLSTKMSHPEWVRGLKQQVVAEPVLFQVSHPEWVRGLKLACTRIEIRGIGVAPRVGAWIETIAEVLAVAVVVGRTPSGCVD